MGLVHPIHIIAWVNGRRRCIACIEIPRADPSQAMIKGMTPFSYISRKERRLLISDGAVVSRVLTLLKKNAKYVALDLAHAENISDEEWERNVEEEYLAAEEEHRRPLPTRWRHVQRRLLNEKTSKLEKECVQADVPRFPFIQMCLYLGASVTGWDTWFIHQLCPRRWNAPPDYGGKYAWEPGCTVIDITDRLSYAMILPAQMSCGVGKKAVYRTLRLRPLDGHDWLRGSGQGSEVDSKRDCAWIEGEDEPAPVTSIDAIREVWPLFPPPPPLVDSDDDDDSDGDDVAETKKKNKSLAEEKASALKTEAKTEGSPGVPEPETEQQTASTSGKRKRGAEPNEDEQRVWDLIERLLVSCTPKDIDTLRRHKNYRPLLKRFMDKYPEHFAPKHKGAVQLILAALMYPKTSIKDLDLHQFRDLSSKQVVEVIKAALAYNATIHKRAPKDLQVLDISFNRLLKKDDIVDIVAETTLDELIIWHNPDLSREDIAQVSKGRIAKVTTRAGFLTALQKFAEQSYRSTKSLHPYEPAPPIISPLPVRIRQVIWMMLGTTDVNPEAPQPDLAGQLSIPEGKLSLEAVDLDTLAVILYPGFHGNTGGVYNYSDENKAHGQLVALPYHDAAWGPLAEFYTSIARFERYMSNESFIDYGYDLIFDRWPLAFPLLMATGSKHSEYVVTAPLPPEALSLATRELQGGTFASQYSLPKRGPYPIVHGEYTLVFLREPDHGRLRVGMATLTEEGELVVLDPEAVAVAASDEKAALAWRRGVGGLRRWTGPTEDEEEEEKPVVVEKKSGETRRRRRKTPDSLSYRYNRDTAPLEVEALKKMLAAAEQLKANQGEIKNKIREVEAVRKRHEEKERDRKALEEEVKPEEGEVKIEDDLQ
ncbi:hypothetical protein F5Y14DRAFT_429277 [Nemania sp. NC0429]|nr:hypothetical protein F5Y14DRAFT_429277 [Nemania sp. NC0429]